MHFAHRDEAGYLLGASVAALAPRDPVVIGLARGGIPVARAVASVLGAPLDVMVARPLYAREEAGAVVGAIAASALYLEDAAVAGLAMPETWLRNAVVEEMAALRRREQVYRHGRRPIKIEGHSVILVDDFLDHGPKERIAIWALRQRHPAEIILAAPFCASRARASLAALVERLVVLHLVDDESPPESHYDEASTTDAEVLDGLRAVATRNASGGGGLDLPRNRDSGPTR